MKTIISLFVLSVLSYGSVNAQSEDRYSNAVKKEITQVNNGPTVLEIKDGDVIVNGEVVTTINDKTDCLRLKINTECAKPAPKKVAVCDPCQRRRSVGSSCGTSRYYSGYYPQHSSCSRCGDQKDRYTYYRDADTPPRYYESYRSGAYGGYRREGSCGCKSHHRDDD